MLAFLAWGFLTGLQHALEPDHLAAVGSLASGRRSRSILSAGWSWGLGHAIPLVLVGGGALLAHATIPERFAEVAEVGVGAMLVILGARVLWTLRRERVHVHVHRHADGTVHAHAHGHRHGEAHDAHEHAPGIEWRSVLVGMTHGLAGSAALAVMAAAAASSAPAALAFVVVFSLGAALGMAALGAAVSFPTRLRLVPEGNFRAVRFVVAGVTIGWGFHLLLGG